MKKPTFSRTRSIIQILQKLLYLLNEKYEKVLNRQLSISNLILNHIKFDRFKKIRYVSCFFFLLVFLAGPNVFAQLPVPFVPRLNGGSIKVKGDIVFIGNSIVTGEGLPQPYNGNDINNNNVGEYINVASGGDPNIFSSSSAELVTDNSCKKIVYAGLYWASVYPTEIATNGNVQFEGSPRFEDWNQVKFKLPTGNFIDLVADNDADPVGEEDDIIFDGYKYYGPDVEDSFKDSPIICYKNVTNLVQGLSEADGNYTLANLRATRGERKGGCSAGWTLVIIYESPVLPSKYITLFDGYAGVQNNTELEIPVSGYQTLPAPYPVNANISVGALEGDIGITGDSFQFKAGTSTNFTVISDAINETNNFFNSSITINGAHNLNRNPASTNTLGLDINNVRIPNPSNLVIPNDATEGQLKLTTNGDGYGAFVTSFAVEIIEPDIVLTKIVEDDAGNNIGGQSVGLGSTLNYVIGFQNTGNDDAIDFQIRDILPVNILFDYPSDLILPPGVTVTSYNPTTRELIFAIEDNLVEENDPVYEIRIEARVVDECNQLADACSNIINNQAFASYRSETNPSFLITDDPSLSSNTGCLLSPQATNFLANLDCLFTEDIVLCGDSVQLTAANGYDSYSWSTSPTGTPVIGTAQSIDVTQTGTYYSYNTAVAPCQSIQQEYVVALFGGTIENPVIPYADEVVTCPNNGKLLPNIFLCGANDERFIQTNISGAQSIIWEGLDGPSCAAVSNPDCANENDACSWDQVGTGADFMANAAGEFRLTINYEGGCFTQFYFNVYQNELSPTVISEDIICTTLGSITVNDVPSGYEYSINGTDYQSGNTFTIDTAGTYTVYVRQIGVPTNPCVFTVPEVQIRDRDFTATTTVLQPLCFGDQGSVLLAANDVDPQYTFEIYNGATLVNSVGPVVGNTYTFGNLNPGTYSVTVGTENGCSFTETVQIIEPPILTVTAAITSPLTCDDGEITIYPVGGTAPYFYFVNSSADFQTVPQIVVTAAGSYDITVVDSNNCSAVTSISIDGILPPEFNVTTTDIACTGNTGAITISTTATNGNSLKYSIDGGATFVSSNVFNALAAGDYDVVVQYSYGGSVCETVPQTVTIVAAEAISGTAELSQSYTCEGDGTITVTGVTGGDAPYTYSIDGVNFQSGNTFTGLTAGTYTITVQDSNACTGITNDIVIEALNPPTDLVFDIPTVTCPANTTTITITNTTGGTGVLEYQIIAPTASATPYQTTTSFPDLEPGSYTFQVRDENGCTYTETVTISPIPTPTVNAVLTSGLDCTTTPDAIITGTITGSAPFTYAVSVNGATYTNLGATTTPFTYNTSTAGTYQFEITDANGCIAQSSTIIVNPIAPPALSLIVESQPILCNGDENGALDITIDDTVGTPPFVINVNNDTTSTDYGSQTSGLSAGTYTVTITDANLCFSSETVTISQPDPIVLDFDTVDITCTAGGISQGSVIINSVSGGTSPYNYFVTGTNGYSNSELNNTGSTSISFDVVDFGLYQINVVDANGCSILVQDVLVASPPTDLDIDIIATVDCLAGGEAVVSVGSSLSSAGPFFFAIYEGPTTVYPNPVGSWIPEDSVGSQSATFTGLIPGVTYTFIVYDASTLCSYYEPATLPIPTNSTLSLTAVSSNNITCTGSDDGNVSFTINSIYGSNVNVSYEIFDSLSIQSTGITGTGTVPANGTLDVPNLGPLPFGNYFVSISETSGPNSGCGVVTIPFNITESAFLLELQTSVDQNANCNASSGVISAIAQNGTAPYDYQITTTATAPSNTDSNWASASTFNLDAGDYYVHVKDAYGCIITSPVVVLPMDDVPNISAVINDSCTINEGEFQIDVTLDTAGIAPYSFSIDGGAYQAMNAPFTISNLFSGTHTIEIQDANGCGNLVTVEIFAPIEITPAISALATCNDDDGEITITPDGGSGTFTYTISPSPASISEIGGVFSGVPSGIYTITITDTVTLCTEDVTISLQQPTPPTFTTSPTAITCFGDSSGSFEIDVNGYSGSYTYEVFDTGSTSVFGVVNADTSTNPLTVTGMVAGSFTVVITETDTPFCSATSTVVIASPTQALDLIATETSNVSCDDGQGTISAVASGGWGTYQYELTGDATVAFSDNGTFTGLSAGTYTVNVMDAGGCTDSVDITLTAPLPISATFTPSASSLSCFGDQNGSITVTNVTGGQGVDYIYTLNTILPTPSTSGPQSSNSFENLGAGTYSVSISDGNACETTSVEIIIAQPSLVIASLVRETGQTCLTESTLTLSATGGTGPYTYSGDSSFTATLGPLPATFAVAPGTYQYYVRDANGCIANVSNEITIDPLPELTISLLSTNPSINCAGDNNGTITATAQGGLGDYVYTLEDTNGNGIAATQNSPGSFTGLVAGTYIVRVVSGDCVEVTEPITITEPLAPLEVEFSVSDITCSGNNDGRLEISATGGTGTIKYAISPQSNQFFETNVFENLSPGNYEVIVQDALGCFVTLEVTITDPEIVIVSIVPGSLYEETCAGENNGEFSIAISGGSLPYSVSLDDYDGPYIPGDMAQAIFEFTELGGGDHAVFVRDAQGCESEWNITFPDPVLIEPSIEIEFLCEDNMLTNTVTVLAGDAIADLSQIDYSLNGAPYQLENVFKNVMPGTGHYIDVRHTNGCIQRTDLFDIGDLAPVSLILSEGSAQGEIIATAEGGTGEYQYTFNNGDSGGTNVFFVTEEGTYTVLVTDSAGCEALASIVIEITGPCIPNYFTPNGDGITDGWTVGCAEDFPNLTFDIYDRYGRKVATYRVGEFWDGKYNGKELPTGDYWYVVNLNSNVMEEEYVGHFTLYR